MYYKFYVSSRQNLDTYLSRHSAVTVTGFTKLERASKVLVQLTPECNVRACCGSQVRLDALESDERIAPTETLLDICGRLEAVFSFLTVLTLGVVALHYNRLAMIGHTLLYFLYVSPDL